MIITLVLLSTVIVRPITVNAVVAADPITYVVLTILNSMGITVATDDELRSDLADDFWHWVDDRAKSLSGDPLYAPSDGLDFAVWVSSRALQDAYSYWTSQQAADDWLNGASVIVNWTGEQYNAIRHCVYEWVTGRIEQNQTVANLNFHAQSSDGIIGWDPDHAFDVTFTDDTLSHGVISIPTPSGRTINYHTFNDCYFLDYDPFKLDYDYARAAEAGDLEAKDLMSEWIDVDLGDGYHLYNVIYATTDVNRVTQLNNTTYFSGFSKSQNGNYYLYSVPGDQRISLFPSSYRLPRSLFISYKNRSQGFITKDGRYLYLKEPSPNSRNQSLYFADDGTLALDLSTQISSDYSLNDWIITRLGYALPQGRGLAGDDYTPTPSIPLTGDFDWVNSIDKDYFPTKSTDVSGQDVYSGDVANNASVSVSVPTTDEGMREMVDSGAQAAIKVNNSTSKPDDLPDIDSSGLFDKFPFCLPIDIYNIFAGFYSSDAQPPKFVIPMRIWQQSDGSYLLDYDLVIDFSILSPIVPIFRFFVSLTFTVCLIMVTRKLIGSQ